MKAFPANRWRSLPFLVDNASTVRTSTNNAAHRSHSNTGSVRSMDLSGCKVAIPSRTTARSRSCRSKLRSTDQQGRRKDASAAQLKPEDMNSGRQAGDHKACGRPPPGVDGPSVHVEQFGMKHGTIGIDRQELPRGNRVGMDGRPFLERHVRDAQWVELLDDGTVVRLAVGPDDQYATTRPWTTRPARSTVRTRYNPGARSGQERRSSTEDHECSDLPVRSTSCTSPPRPGRTPRSRYWPLVIGLGCRTSACPSSGPSTGSGSV